MLRSRRWGQIVKVENPNEIAYNTFYHIRLYNGDGPLEPIRLDGLQIESAIEEFAVDLIRKQKFKFIDDHTANRIMTYRLSALEWDAVDQYCAGAYKEWNKGLREKGTRNPHINALIGLLQRLPKYSKTVFRRIGWGAMEEEVWNKFKSEFTVGQKYTTPQFYSTCASTKFMSGDVGSFGKDKYKAHVKIHTAGRHGATLRLLTGQKDMNEQEILFPPGTTFTVRKAELNTRSGFLDIELAEEGARAMKSVEQKIPAFKGPPKQKDKN
jgi:hypothetical protein